MEAAAIPVVKEVMELEDKHGHHHRHHVGDRLRRLSGRRDVSENMLLFGGHAAPPLDVPYQVTVKDNRDSCHAISMMKVSNTSYHALIAGCKPALETTASTYNICPVIG